jgi:pimeloyl-ACP methyl ester carboxylesterase
MASNITPEHDGLAEKQDVPGGFTFVASADGTRIAYRRYGQGPAVLLLHGSMETSFNHIRLAEELAGTFTVCVPDRRGRGQSGPYGDAYSLAREVEDVAAVQADSGATRIFGVSAGGLVALEAARVLPALQQAVLYEPAVLAASAPISFDWISRFDREIAAGNPAAAMVTSMIGLRLGPPVLSVIPRRFLASLTERLMRSEGKKAKPGDVTMRMLAPSVRYEGQLLAEAMGTTAKYADVQARVLLLSGSKGLSWLKPSLADLAETLPRVERIEYSGLDHGGSSDVTKANPKGKPELVATDMRRFFAEP